MLKILKGVSPDQLLDGVGEKKSQQTPTYKESIPTGKHCLTAHPLLLTESIPTAES